MPSGRPLSDTGRFAVCHRERNSTLEVVVDMFVRWDSRFVEVVAQWKNTMDIGHFECIDRSGTHCCKGIVGMGIVVGLLCTVGLAKSDHRAGSIFGNSRHLCIVLPDQGRIPLRCSLKI